MKPTLRMLCIAPYPVENAAVRYRVLQYLPYLSQKDVEVTFRPFMDSRFFGRFYEPGHALQQTLGLIGYALRRSLDVLRSTRHDLVLIHREAAPAGPPVIETIIAKVARKPVVFDFDDAVHVLHAITVHRRIASRIKYPQKTAKTIGMSRAIIAGNRSLAQFASDRNPSVTVIPTVVNATQVRPLNFDKQPSGSQRHHYNKSSRNRPVVVGWIGSHSSYP